MLDLVFHTNLLLNTVSAMDQMVMSKRVYQVTQMNNKTQLKTDTNWMLIYPPSINKITDENNALKQSFKMLFYLNYFVHAVSKVAFGQFRHHHCIQGSTVMMKSNIMVAAAGMLAGTLAGDLVVQQSRSSQMLMLKLLLW